MPISYHHDINRVIEMRAVVGIAILEIAVFTYMKYSARRFRFRSCSADERRSKLQRSVPWTHLSSLHIIYTYNILLKQNFVIILLPSSHCGCNTYFKHVSIYYYNAYYCNKLSYDDNSRSIDRSLLYINMYILYYIYIRPGSGR